MYLVAPVFLSEALKFVSLFPNNYLLHIHPLADEKDIADILQVKMPPKMNPEIWFKENQE